jgi:glycosyltransferase involved in cell wall biosynthesis
MKFLFCCENYHPSVGGVQEVMRQVASRLAAAGDSVWIACSHHSRRPCDTVIEGVRVVSFPVSGNAVRGMHGPVAGYQDLLCNGQFDAILIKAAQQWTFDAAVPILDRVRCRKVFIPCGFSALRRPDYARYYEQMPRWLSLFDAVIYYGRNGQDRRFARDLRVGPNYLVSNGADEREFRTTASTSIRAKLGVPKDHQLLLTIGTRIPAKGHWELLRAFRRARLRCPCTLVINANVPGDSLRGRALSNIKTALRGFVPLGLLGPAVKITQPSKAVRVVDLPRAELVALLREADLFVLASWSEYAPLVLYESMAAGTPFLSTDVGIAREMAEDTGAGVVLRASAIGPGAVDDLAEGIEKLMGDTALRVRMHDAGCKAFGSGRFDWRSIAVQYRAILAGTADAELVRV